MENAIKEFSWNSNSTLVRVAWIVLPIVTLFGLFLPITMTVAAMAYFLMVAGLICHKEKVVHFRLMITAITLDILLVLALEILKSAIETAASMELGWPQQTHILFSLLAVLFYFPVIYLGRKRYLNQATAIEKSMHFKLGIVTFTFRTIGFLFMFSMLFK